MPGMGQGHDASQLPKPGSSEDRSDIVLVDQSCCVFFAAGALDVWPSCHSRGEALAGPHTSRRAWNAFDSGTHTALQLSPGGRVLATCVAMLSATQPAAW